MNNFEKCITLNVGKNLSATSALDSARLFISNKLIPKKNDTDAMGPYEICSTIAFVIPVRKFVFGHIELLNRIQQ